MGKKLTTEEFVRRSNLAHNEFYHYPDEYKGNNEKIRIICPIHGEFFSRPQHHMNGHKCGKCAGSEKLTTEIFVNRSNIKHNFKYQYPEEYVDSHTKIGIICPIHGMFYTYSASHLNGVGCQKCSKCYRRSHEEFVDECNLIHNFKYQYPQKLTKTMEKVQIECPIHGIFYQMLNDHLRGFNCAKCAGLALKTTEEFIREANIKHNNFYNYDLTVYVNATTPVKIICPVHGVFETTPTSHLDHNCPKCSKRYVRTLEDFVSESSIKHDNFYDYSLVQFENMNSKVKIICPVHGIFEQTASAHVGGSRCGKCFGNPLKTTEEFISDAKKLHGENGYDYSLVNYINSNTPVTIICKRHGPFIQRPSDHLDMCGCKFCRMSSGEKRIVAILQENNIKFKPQYSFPDCKNILELKFDFGILNNDSELLGLIEFHGKQHYFPYDFSGKLNEEETLLEFEKLKTRDKIKSDYCEKNHIKILEIPYTMIKHMDDIVIGFVKEIMDKHLN